MKRIGLWLVAFSLWAAEPDWPALERRAVELLQQYVRIESVNPPADTRAAAAFLKAELDKNGITVRLYPSGPTGQTNLVARLPGKDPSKKPLLLLNHMDVVPVDRQAWKIEPFAAILRDGCLWGRGSLDMKSLGLEHLLALIALRQAGAAPARDIVMLSTADEETGGDWGIRWMIANHYREIDAEYVLDEGGFGTRDILATGKLVFGIMVGEKQTLWLRLRAAGTAGHGSQPLPDNANLILLEAIRNAMALPPVQPHPVVAEMIGRIGAPLAANRYTAAIQGNTVSLTTLASGVGNPAQVNVIPSAAEATLDCRLLPGVDARKFLADMRARIHDPRVSLEPASISEDAGISHSRTPLFEAIRRALQKHHPGAVVTPLLVPHGTDSVNLRRRGVTAYGFTPMVLDLATNSSAHSDAERVPVAEFLKGLRILYDVLRSDF
jgi:acetylornithine deacetylase/succinyl-diaminopimelate desuccinylase-like protein